MSLPTVDCIQPTSLFMIISIKHSFSSQQDHCPPYVYSSSKNLLFPVIQVNARQNLIWSTSNQVTGAKWARALVHIGHYKTGIRILFKATRVYSSNLPVAIDDTSFIGCLPPSPSGGTCAPSQLTCASGACVDKIYACDLTDDCGDGTDEAQCSGAHQVG